MKKLLAAVLCICMIATLSACAEDPVPTTDGVTTAPAITTAPPTETTTPGEGAVALFEGNLIYVALPTTTESVYADDQTLIGEYRYPEAIVSLPDADIAEIISLDLLNLVDASTAPAQQIMDAAKQSYKKGEEFYHYQYDVSYTVTRLDQNILSLYCTEASYDGSPRTFRSAYSVTYDLATGNKLSLRSVLQDEFSADVLCQLILEGIPTEQRSQLFPDHETTVLDKFSTNVPVDSWYFTSEGLCFYFEPYEIAPIALGNIVSTIPYDKLSGMMEEQFFPSEQPDYIGDVTVTNITGNLEASIQNFSQFAELTVESGTEQLLLSTTGSVSDLRIFESTENGTEPVMIFAAAAIGPTDAVIIEAKLSDASRSFTVQYKTGSDITTIPLQ